MFCPGWSAGCTLGLSARGAVAFLLIDWCFTMDRSGVKFSLQLEACFLHFAVLLTSLLLCCTSRVSFSSFRRVALVGSSAVRLVRVIIASGIAGSPLLFWSIWPCNSAIQRFLGIVVHRYRVQMARQSSACIVIGRCWCNGYHLTLLVSSRYAHYLGDDGCLSWMVIRSFRISLLFSV